MIITKRTIPRRTVLRGMGTALALPLLDAMIPALSAASTAAASPTRLGFYYVPNGVQMVSWTPPTDGANFSFSPILKSLEPFRHHVVVVSGLSNSAADAIDVGSGPHTRSAGTWLSGVKPKRTEGGDIQAGITLDQYAAQVLGTQTPLTSLEIALEPNFTVGNCEGGYSCTYINTFSWRTPTRPLPMETNPHVVFERLFGDGGTGAARLRQMQNDRSILDAVRGEMARLQRSLGTGDRAVVMEYFDAVRDVERRIQKTEQQAIESRDLHLEKPLGIPERFDDHAAIMLDLQLLAYRADITRVVSFQIARELSTRAYPEIGVLEAHHDLSHALENAEKIAKNTKVNAYHLGLVARFVEKLKATPDGDGSLLDHTLLLYGCGMGDGAQHSAHNLPVVLIGGAGGKLAGNRHQRYPIDTPMMNLGLSVLEKVRAPQAQIGDSTGLLAEI